MNQGKIKLIKAIVHNNQFDNMSPKEKKRFIMFTCMVRDLNLLQKCLIFTSNEKNEADPFHSAKATNIFFFLKTLISKLHEMWFFIKKNKILDESESYSGLLKEKIEKMKDFFSDENEKVEKIFSFIRNKFGFHYEYWDDVDILIDNSSKSFSSYEAWLSKENSGNEIFSTSNGIILKVVFSEMLNNGFKGDESKLMAILFDLAIKGAKIFQEFSKCFLAEGFSVKWEQQEEIEINVPLISDVHLPLMVAKQ